MAEALTSNYVFQDWRYENVNLRDKLEYAYENRLFTDLIFVVGQEKEKFETHAFILKLQSHTFEKNFGNGMEIDLLKFDAKYFGIFLKYLYIEQEGLITSSECAISILNMAREFEITKLSKMCLNYLKKNINIENAGMIFTKSYEYNEEELKEFALQFILENAEKVFHSADFFNLNPVCLEHLLKYPGRKIDELSLFKILLNWGKQVCERENLNINGKNLRKVAYPLIRFVNFEEISMSNVKRYVAVEEILTSDELVKIYHDLITTTKETLNEPVQTEIRQKKFLPSSNRHKGKILPEENYGKILERSVKIYESQMDRMSKIPNFNEMVCYEGHENCRRKAMENFYSNVEENSSNLEYFGQELEDGIEKYYKKILNQIPKLKPIKEISSQTEPKNMMIGIHFGAKHIRCSIFQNSKFVQIPNKDGKFAIPNCVAFENNRIIFGGAAFDYYKKFPSSSNCYNFNEIKLDRFGQNIFEYPIKLILGIVLSNVKLMAEGYLKMLVHSCVISVPSSVNFNFREELLTASQIAGFEKTHIVSEAVAAGYLYAFKRKEYPDTSKLLVTYSAKNQFDVTSLLVGIRGITVCSTSGLHKLKFLKNKNSSRITSLTNWKKSVLSLSEADESYIFCDAIESSNFSKFDEGIQLRDCNYTERYGISNLFRENSIELAGQSDSSDGVSYGTGLLAYQLTSGYLAPSAIKELSPFDNFFLNRSNPFYQNILNDHKFIRKLMCQEMSVDPNVIQMCQLEEGIKRLSEKIEEFEGILKNQRTDVSDIHEIIQRSKIVLNKFDATFTEVEEHFSRLLSSWKDVLAIMK